MSDIEKKPSLPPRRPEVLPRGEPVSVPGVERGAEESELKKGERIISQELRRELELMQADENLAKEAQAKARQIQDFSEEEKIQNLLAIAREKGVIYAVKVAQSMNDPYLLDTFHDVLAREGLYKDYIK